MGDRSGFRSPAEDKGILKSLRTVTWLDIAVSRFDVTGKRLDVASDWLNPGSRLDMA